MEKHRHSQPAHPTWTTRLAGAFLAAVIAGIPLLIAPGWVLQYETTPKLALLLFGTAGLLACSGAWWAGAVALFENRTGRRLILLFATLSFSLIVSTFLSVRPAVSLAGSSWRRFGLVTQLSLALVGLIAAALVIGHKNVLRPVLISLAAATAAISVYALLQYAGFDLLLNRSSYTIWYDGALIRVPGTLGSAVYLGSFLAAALPIVIGLAGASGGWRRPALYMIAALAIAAITLSGSRSAFLGIGAAAAVSLPALVRLPKSTLYSAAVALGLLVAAFFAFLNTGASASFRLRLRQWGQDFYGGPRLLVWRESLGLIAEHPLFGSGPDTFGSEFRRRQSERLSRAYPEFFQESPHNILLEGTIAQGCVFPLFLIGIGGLILAGCGQSKGGPEVWLRACATASLVTQLLLPFTISGGLMLYGALGLLVGTRVYEYREPRAMAFSLRVASIITAILVTLAGIAYVRKDAGYADLANAARVNRFDQMLRAYETTAAMLFPVSGEDLWCSRQFAAAARASGSSDARAWRLAADAAARAEVTDDNPADAMYQSALLAVSANNAIRAESSLRKAIVSAPAWYKPHLLLAQLLYFTGRTADARGEALRALSLAGPSRTAVENVLRPVLP